MLPEEIESIKDIGWGSLPPEQKHSNYVARVKQLLYLARYYVKGYSWTDKAPLLSLRHQPDIIASKKGKYLFVEIVVTNLNFEALHEFSEYGSTLVISIREENISVWLCNLVASFTSLEPQRW